MQTFSMCFLSKSIFKTMFPSFLNHANPASGEQSYFYLFFVCVQQAHQKMLMYLLYLQGCLQVSLHIAKVIYNESRREVLWPLR